MFGASKHQNDETTTLTRFYEKLPFHVLFFILYPVLSLYVTNKNQIPFYAIIRSLILIAVLSLMIYLVSLIFLGSHLKAALLTSAFNLLFNFYGHAYTFLSQLNFQGIDIARHSLLTILWVALAVMALVGIIRLNKNLCKVTQASNFIGGVLLLFILFQMNIPNIFLKIINIEKNTANPASYEPRPGPSNPNTVHRDVYYIIVDGYTRADILANEFDFNNSPFITELENIGFTILTSANSNYDNTFDSLVSTLNMDYLDNMGISDSDDFDKRMLLIGDTLPHNKVRSIFEDMGYTTIAFHTKAPWANLSDADIYYEAEINVPKINRLETLLFHDLYLKTSWVRLLFDTQGVSVARLASKYPALQGWIDPNNYAISLMEISDQERFESIRYGEYKQNLYSLDSLQKVPEIPGNKFVHAHIMVTHSSFVFNADGSYKQHQDESDKSYIEQIAFLNNRLIEIVDTILENSDPTPIIIIQADHGYRPGEGKVAILHALFLPDGGEDLVYPEFTPVNTFRVVLNHYFDYQYDLLPDKSYYRSEDGDELIEIIHAGH